jgi:hypothetical protein
MAGTRRLFGPSKSDVWRQLSAQIGARYVEGRFWKGDQVQATHEEWTVTLDTYTVSHGNSSTTYTRMRAPYVNPFGLRFSIYRRGLFSDIAKRFGMQDIEVGDPAFDRDFIVKATDEALVRGLLANATIRDLIARQPKIHLSIKDDEGWLGRTFPPEVDELHFLAVGVIKDVERLKLLYELFAEVLDQLCAMGLARPDAPRIDV